MPSLAVLTQRHESQHRPIGYCSEQLDLVSKGLPSFGGSHCGPCQSTAACRRFNNGPPLALYAPHSMEALLNSRHTQHLSVSRLTSYEVLLLSSSNVTIAHCNTLLLSFLCPAMKPLTLPRIIRLLTPQIDIQKTPLKSAELLRFTDGSSLKYETSH